MRRFSFVLILVLTAIPAFAQQVEVTPFFGYRMGGEFQADAINPYGDVEIDDSESYGLMVNIPLTPWSQIELLADFQNSNFGGNGHILLPPEKPRHRSLSP